MTQDHEITHSYIQRGESRTAKIECSCGRSIEVDFSQESLRVGEARLEKLHEKKSDRKILMDAGGSLPKPNMEVVEADLDEPRTTKDLADEQRAVNKAVKKHRKSKRHKPVAETKTTKSREPKLEPDEDWPDESGDQS